MHALLGENGAGKSTLMNILYGLYKADAGRSGSTASRYFTSAERRDRGRIGMVHQHFMLIPVMTVAENIVLGTEPRREGMLLDEAPPSGGCRSSPGFNFAVDPTHSSRTSPSASSSASRS